MDFVEGSLVDVAVLMMSVSVLTLFMYDSILRNRRAGDSSVRTMIGWGHCLYACLGRGAR